MTRINLVNVQSLADQHLFAEWREIKRVPVCLEKRLQGHSIRSTLQAIPAQFTLGTGHVTFFYDKMAFLSSRYTALTAELLKRGYNVDRTLCVPFDLWLGNIPAEFCLDAYTPSKRDLELSASRIVSKLEQKPMFYKWYGRIYAIEHYLGLML